MDKAIGFIEKAITKMTPNYLTFTMFITMFINLFSVFLYFFRFDIYKFDDETVEIINKIWAFDIVKCFLFFVLTFNFLGWVVYKLRVKGIVKYSIENMYTMIGNLHRGYGLFLSLYILFWVIQYDKNISMEPTDNFFSNLVLYACALIISMNFINVLRLFFYDDGKYEIELKEKFQKEQYITDTIEKYESANIEKIKKDILLLELYQRTEELYDKGIKVNKEHFECQKRHEDDMKYWQKQSEELSDKYNNYNTDEGEY